MRYAKLLTAFLGSLAAITLAHSTENHASENVDTLSQAVVTGTRVAMERDLLPVPVTIIGRPSIERSDRSSILPSVMEQTPGLYVTSRGVTGYGVSTGAAGGISIRGLGGANGRVLILIDGHPQYMTIYGHPVADQYMSADAERIEVSRGASSVLYGSNAMGGTINIITRRPAHDGNSFSFKLLGGSYGTLTGAVSDSYKSGRLSTTVSGSFDRTNGHRERSSFNSKSGYGRIGYDFSPSWKGTATLSLMDAFSENPGTVAQPMYEGTSHVIRGVAGLSLDNKFDRTSGSADVFLSWGNHIINDGHVEGRPSQKYLFHGTDYMAGANVWQAVNLFKGNTLTAGADLKVYGDNAYRDPVNEIYADHIRLHEEALYIFDQYELGSLLLNGGLRLEHHKLYGAILVPQAGIAWKAAPGTTLKASASKGFRTPNLRELYMYAVANEELLPEDAWSYDFTLSQSALDGRLNAEVGAFYTKGNNIIEVVQMEGRRQNRNAGSFANKGIEASLSFRILDNLSLNSNYSFLKMDKPLVGAPEHKFYLGCDYSVGKFSVNAGLMGIGGLYLQTGEDTIKENYSDLKARVSYSPLPWLTLLLRGENLLNQTYETMLGFPMPGATVMGGVSINL